MLDREPYLLDEEVLTAGEQRVFNETLAQNLRTVYGPETADPLADIPLPGALGARCSCGVCALRTICAQHREDIDCGRFVALAEYGEDD